MAFQNEPESRTRRSFSLRKKAAIATIKKFVSETTGKEASQQEIANALKRYFVLNEIKAHILLEREESVK